MPRLLRHEKQLSGGMVKLHGLGFIQISLVGVIIIANREQMIRRQRQGGLGDFFREIPQVFPAVLDLLPFTLPGVEKS